MKCEPARVEWTVGPVEAVVSTFPSLDWQTVVSLSLRRACEWVWQALFAHGKILRFPDARKMKVFDDTWAYEEIRCSFPWFLMGHGACVNRPLILCINIILPCALKTTNGDTRYDKVVQVGVEFLWVKRLEREKICIINIPCSSFMISSPTCQSSLFFLFHFLS